MKKILVALLVLALVAPAMADVAITSSFNNTTKDLTISFNPTAATVRGVAVTVTIDCAQVDAYVSSSFNTFVDYAFNGPVTPYAISMPAQHPLALAAVAGVATLPIATDTPFAVSVGYLDQTGAQLGLTTAGTVAVIHLASINPAGGTVTVVANAARGGAVVGDTIGAVTVTGTTIPAQGFNLTTSSDANCDVTTPAVEGGHLGLNGSVAIVAGNFTAGYQFNGWTGTGVTAGKVANPALASTTITMDADYTVIASSVLISEAITQPTIVKTTAGTSVKNVSGTVGDPARVNSGRVETFVASATDNLGHALEYNFTYGDTTTSGWGAATRTKTYTYAAAATYNVTVQARCIAHPLVTSVASANFVCTSEAVKSTAAFYATWAAFSRPNCWAFQRNCRGDTNNAGGGIGVNKTWVDSTDLLVLAAAFNKTETPLKTISYSGIPGICADTNRAGGGIGVNKTWVDATDLGIFSGYFNKTQASVPVCAQTSYWYWTTSL